jgi:UDP-N-acetylglucosamine--N-acetylmuramyl-(pentapeptide) pyrophosphoryl-undecaprenol N-acetylglucosamine transferase
VALQGDLPTGFRVIHQTGTRDEEQVRRQYQQAGIVAEVSGFFDDMATIYRQADLLVSRAGATSLAELCVLGKPAILLPYPYAADNHQEFNARLVVERGGALMYREAELSGTELAGRIVELLNDRARLKEMGERARQVAYPEATVFMVRECLKLSNKKNRSAVAEHV